MENPAIEECKANLESCEFDQDESDKASKFRCDCKYNDGNPCYQLFTQQEMIHRREVMRELTHRDQMLILLGKISCSLNNEESTSTSRRKEQSPRQRQRTLYWLEGKKICRETFKFLHAISQDRLTGLLSHYKDEGISPKEKKSGGRKSNTRTLLSNQVFSSHQPNVLHPPGLSPQRKQYLFKHITQFVDDPYKDVVIPMPEMLAAENLETDEVENTPTEQPRPAKRGRSNNSFGGGTAP